MSILTEEIPYISNLDAVCLSLAKSELNEDEKNRDGAVETLREWLKQQPWLHTPLGTRYLLKYLRNTKFSQLAARAKLESCWTIRTNCPEWFADRDPAESKMREFLKLGFMLRLPRLDNKGRTFLLARPGSVDLDQIKKHPDGVNMLFKVFTSVLDWMCMDERTQINGIVFIVDQSKMSLAHKAQIYTLENSRRLVSCLQNVFPMRLKKINVYNPPVYMEAAITLVKTFMKEKLRERIDIHGKSLVSLYEKIGMTVLPLEYLPDDFKGPNSGSVQSIIDSMIESMSKPEVAEYIKNLGDYRIDLDKKPDDKEPAASFRKLNVD